MIFLTILLLFFGLLQSFLELKKEKTEPKKLTIAKVLSILYILIFVGGVIIAFVQSNDNNKFNQTIDNLSFSVRKIDSTASEQLLKLNESISETERLLLFTDSMNSNLKDVVEIRDSLISQTTALNKSLATQLSIDKKSLQANRPIISLSESDIKWQNRDSTSKAIDACIRNLGKRNAFITKLSAEVIFFDKGKNPVFHVPFPLHSNSMLLQPTNLAGQRICLTTYGIKNVKQNLANIEFAAICLNVQYTDVLDESRHTAKLYSGWNSDLNVFSKLKDWQLQLAQEWITKNSILP